jgi:ribonuclease-3 family protein
MIRTWLCEDGTTTAKRLHSRAVSFVSAKAQAAALDLILSDLNEDETAVYKRGRNTHVNAVPKASTHEEYHAATGLETLFGYLYLNGCTERLNELFRIIVNSEVQK